MVEYCKVGVMKIALTADHTAEDVRQMAKAGSRSVALTNELLRRPEAFPGYFDAGTP